MSAQTLVVGSDGTIGSALVRRLAEAGERVLVTSRRRTMAPGVLLLDLAEKEDAWPPLPDNIAVAYVCAAVARHEQCTRDPEGSRRVNVEGTVALARRLRARGAMVVWLSTNQVFDGAVAHMRADRPHSPRSAYGRQKAEAETALLALGDGVCVVRLSKVVTPDMPLVQGWLGAFREGRVLRPFHDMSIAPVAVDRVVEMLLRAGRQRTSGILQLTGPEDMSYAEAAETVAAAVGAPAGLIEPASWRDASLDLEWVPRYTSLDVTRAVEELAFEPEDSRAALLRVCVGNGA